MSRKPIFDTFRRLLGRGMTQREVDEINRAMDSALSPDAPSEAEKLFSPKAIGAQGKKLIRDFEGYETKLPDGRVKAYWDSHGAVWTIAWGLTGPDIGRDTVWTAAEANRRFDEYLERYADDVKKALGSSLAATSQAQFDALVSFHYNTGAIFRATLTRKHKAGDFAGAAREFSKWVKAGGVTLKGLVRRRAAEAELYRSGS